MDTLHFLFLIQQEYSLVKLKAKGIKTLISLQQPEPPAGIKALQNQVLELWEFQFSGIIYSLQSLLLKTLKQGERTQHINIATSVAFFVNAVFYSLCHV